MRNVIPVAALLTFAAFATAEIGGVDLGEVVEVVQPSADGPGVLVLRQPDREGYKLRSFVFSRRLADGLPPAGEGKRYWKFWPTLPADLKKGDWVTVDFGEANNRLEVRGVRK